MINWREIAPKRKDWVAISEKFKAAGIPHDWINGIPAFREKVTEEQINRALDSKPVEARKHATKRKK